MGIFAVLTKRQSFEDQLKRLRWILEANVSVENLRLMTTFLQNVNVVCEERGDSPVERFKAVEGVFAFLMWKIRHGGAEPSPAQCRMAGVPEWFITRYANQAE
jgi:hypothetical protein